MNMKCLTKMLFKKWNKKRVYMFLRMPYTSMSGNVTRIQKR